ncbi:hypothetical protein [Curtobacterium sp. L1-20]|uniref:hypothetical protein n=1 Tax=Curtobacterium sp. L1-20 TaxID=3138181 RepID=UPI003B527C2B
MFKTVLTAITLTVIDAAFVAGTAGMMWWNAGTTVVDLTPIAAVMTVVTGTTILIFRELLNPRARQGLITTSATRAEVLVVILDVVAVAALLAVWMTTGLYLLGWYACFAGATLLTGHLVQLFADILVRVNAGGDHGRAEAARRSTGLAALHAGGSILGIATLVATRDVHTWSAPLLNGTVVLIVLSMLLGASAAWGIRRMRTSSPSAQASR